jgi:chromosome partitioning protein
MSDREPVDEPRAVAIALTKGGVGKTAMAINLADRLEERGRTLLVDIDPAGNATEGVGHPEAYDHEDHIGLYLQRAANAADGEPVDPSLDDIIIEREGFDLIPSNIDLSTTESVIDAENRFAILLIKQQLLDIVLGDRYDYVVFDTPGDSDSLFREAAIYGAGNVIVPMTPAEESVRGFETLLRTEIVPAREHTDVDIISIVPNEMLSDNESRWLVDELNESFGDLLPPFAHPSLFDDADATDPGIRQRIAFKRAWREGVPLSEYDPESDMLDRLDELAEIVVRGGIDGE